MSGALSLQTLIEEIGGDQNAALDMLGLSSDRGRYYLRFGLSLEHAERLAQRAGLHPVEVWPDIYDDLELEPEVREEVTSASVVSGRKACGLVGVSYRQMDYWVRSGLVPVTVGARGPGSRRGFSFEDVVYLDVVARGRRAGIQLDALIEALKAQWSSPPPGSVSVVARVEGVSTVLRVRSFDEILAGATPEDRAAYGRERTVVRAAL